MTPLKEFDEMMNALTDSQWVTARQKIVPFLVGETIDPDDLRAAVRLVLDAIKKAADVARLLPGGVNTIPFMLTAMNFRKYQERSLHYRLYVLRWRFIRWIGELLNRKKPHEITGERLNSVYEEMRTESHMKLEQIMVRGGIRNIDGLCRKCRALIEPLRSDEIASYEVKSAEAPPRVHLIVFDGLPKSDVLIVDFTNGVISMKVRWANKGEAKRAHQIMDRVGPYGDLTQEECASFIDPREEKL